MPVLPNSRDYDANLSPIPLAGAGALQYRRRRLRPLGRRRARPACHPARASRTAREDTITYGWLRETSNRLANVLRAHGIARGDRVAILLPQMPEVAAAHIAIYKLGAVALPLAVLFGTDALCYRLQNSGAKALITNAQGVARIAEIRKNLPDLKLVLSLDGAATVSIDFAMALARASPDFTPVDTVRRRSGDDDLHLGHHRPAERRAARPSRAARPFARRRDLQRFLSRKPATAIWTPADWAWAGGLLNVLLPGLHYGVPVVARRFEKFDPEEAFALMARAQIRNAFIPPTALRMMRAAPNPRGRHDLKLRIDRLRRRVARRRNL